MPCLLQSVSLRLKLTDNGFQMLATVVKNPILDASKTPGPLLSNKIGFKKLKQINIYMTP